MGSDFQLYRRTAGNGYSGESAGCQYGGQFGDGEIGRIVCHESSACKRVLDACTDRCSGTSPVAPAGLGT